MKRLEKQNSWLTRCSDERCNRDYSGWWWCGCYRRESRKAKCLQETVKLRASPTRSLEASSTCLLHCAAITCVCPSHSASCVPHSEPHRPPHGAPHHTNVQLLSSVHRCEYQHRQDVPTLRIISNHQGYDDILKQWESFVCPQFKSLNCVGNPLHVTFFSAFLPLYWIVVQRILMGSRMRSHGWETTQLPLSPRHKIFFPHKFFVYTKYHMAGLKYGIRDECM